jgi:hypothetical protein
VEHIRNQEIQPTLLLRGSLYSLTVTTLIDIIKHSETEREGRALNGICLCAVKEKREKEAMAGGEKCEATAA